MSYEAGTAFLQVVPSFAGVVSDIAKEAEGWGTEAGKVFTDAFNDIVKEGTGSEVGPSDETSTRSGDSAGGKFADAFRARVDAALKNLPDGTVNLNDEEAEAKLADIRARLETLRNLNIGIDIKDTDALAALSVLKADLDELGAKSPSIRVKVDTAAAVTELQAVRAAADEASGSGGSGGGLSGLFGLGEEGVDVGVSFSDVLVPSLIAGGLALVPIAGLAAGAGAAFAGMAGAALAGVGAFALAAGASGELTYALDLGKAAVSDWAAQFKPEVVYVLGQALQDLTPFLNDLNPLVDAGAQALSGFLTSMGNIANSNAFKWFIGTLADQVGPAVQTLGTAIEGLGGAFATMFEQMAKSGTLSTFEGAIEHIVGDFSKWVDNGGFQGFLNWLQQNGPAIANDLKNIAGDFGQLLPALAKGGGFILTVASAWTRFENAVFSVLEPITHVKSGLANMLIAISGVGLIVEVFKNHWQGAWQGVQTVWHTIDGDVLQPLVAFFTDSVPHAISVFSGAITTGFQAVHNIVNTVWHAIENDVAIPFSDFFLQTIPHALDTAVGFFSALPGRIGGALQSVQAVISGAFGDVGGWVNSHVIQPVVHLFSALPGDIGHAVGAAISGLSSIGKDLIDDIIGGINDGINLINSHIPSILGHKIFPSIPDIPKLATGGPVFPGMPYIVGELGAELFVPSQAGQIVPNSALAATPLSFSGSLAGVTSPPVSSSLPNIDLSGIGAPAQPRGPAIVVQEMNISDPTDADHVLRTAGFLYNAGRL